MLGKRLCYHQHTICVHLYRIGGTEMMSLVLIESDGTLRSVLHCLLGHAYQPISDFTSATEALSFLETASEVLTVLTTDAEPEFLRLLRQTASSHTHRLIILPPAFVAQLLQFERRLDRLIGDVERHPPKQPHADVTLAQWAQIVAFLPMQPTIGRPTVDPQQTLNGILYILHTGTAWNTMPERYGSYVTCWRRWRQWQRDGTWQRIQEVLAS